MRETCSNRRNNRRYLKLQRLEDRLLLAAEPIISEFLSSNQNILVDEAGDSSDWIEVRNIGDETLDLGGWHLTDNDNNLTKVDVPGDVPPGRRLSRRVRVGQEPYWYGPGR